jgi:ABC-type amino acid transport substrate-binding protein
VIRDVRTTSWLLLVSVVLLVTCSDPRKPSKSATTTSPASESGPPRASQEPEKSTASIANEPLPEFDTSLPSWVLELLQRPFAGDLDEMVKRRVIRAGVAFNRTNYFVDHGTQRGVMFAYLNHFETMLNTKLRKGKPRVHVVFVPLARDKLLPALTEGRVDVVAAQLTVTPGRRDVVDFSDPYRTNVSEVVVTGPAAPAVKSVEDLSGQEVFVRRTSSYFDSLRALNARLESEGRMPVSIREVPENLEADDLLEMVNAGLIGMTVVDDYLADLWVRIFTDLRVHKPFALVWTVVLRDNRIIDVDVTARPAQNGSPEMIAWGLHLRS